MKPVDSQPVIRISTTSYGKLAEMARHQHLSKTKVASRIISHYYSTQVRVDLPSPDDYAGMMTVLSNLDSKVSKILGPVERTEDWIKSLVRADRTSEADFPASDRQNPDTADPQSLSADDRLLQALGLLKRLFDGAIKTTDFEGRAAMQIRLSQDDYVRLKFEYDELCTSRNM